MTFYATQDDVDATKLSARIRKGGRFRPLDYSEFESASTSIRQHDASRGGYPETLIELDGRIPAGTAQDVQNRLWAHFDSHARERSLPHRLGRFLDGAGRERTGYTLALVQLLIARRVVLIENEQLSEPA